MVVLGLKWEGQGWQGSGMKGHEESFGDSRYLHYLDDGDGFISIYLHENLNCKERNKL